MVRLTLIASGILVARTMAHGGHTMQHHTHTHTSPMMDEAIRSISESCSNDVRTLCSMPGELTSNLRMDWGMNRLAPPPPLMMDDISSVLDSMMENAIRMSNEQPFLILVSTNEAPMDTTPSEKVFVSMISDLADHVTSNVEPEVQGEEDDNVWTPRDFSKRLVDYGANVLASETNEERRRLARRLTEVRPDMFHGRPPYRLPFGCPKNRCLMRAFEQGAVSSSCAESLQRIEAVANAEIVYHGVVVEQRNQLFIGIMGLYIILGIAAIFVIHQGVHKMHRGNRRLGRRILQAVYNNPDLKAAVAADLNEELGNVPPLPPHVLDRMSGKGHNERPFCVFLKFVVLTVMLTFIVLHSFVGAAIIYLVFTIRFLYVAYYHGKNGPEQSCSCCCCGLSTDDVALGNLTDAQACCTCCNGLGVCAPGCASCCGSDPCGCCTDGCDCCSGSSPGICCNKSSSSDCCSMKGQCDNVPRGQVRRAKEHCYMGIPVQVV